MTGLTDVCWPVAPENHDDPAAEAHLKPIAEPSRVAALVGRLGVDQAVGQ